MSLRLLIVLLTCALGVSACEQQSAQEAAESNGTRNDTVSQGGRSAVGLKEPVQLRLASFSQGTSFYTYGAAIGALVWPQLPPGSSFDVLPLAGGVANPKLLAQGRVDLALNFTINSSWAYQGIVAYETRMGNLRSLVGGLAQYYLGIIVARDLPVQSLPELLLEKKLPIDLYTITVGGQGDLWTRMLLETYGLGYADIEAWGGSVHHTSFDVIKSAFQDNRADLMVYNFTKGHPSITEIALMSPVRFLPFPDDVIQKFAEWSGIEALTLPAGSFHGQDKDIPTLGWSTSLDTTTGISEDIAYLVTKAVVEGKDQLAAAHNSLQDFDRSTAARKVGIPLHGGAERYYREMGLLE